MAALVQKSLVLPNQEGCMSFENDPQYAMVPDFATTKKESKAHK